MKECYQEKGRKRIWNGDPLAIYLLVIENSEDTKLQVINSTVFVVEHE